MRSHNPHIFCSLLPQEISKKIYEKEEPFKCLEPLFFLHQEGGKGGVLTRFTPEF